MCRPNQYDILVCALCRGQGAVSKRDEREKATSEEKRREEKRREEKRREEKMGLSGFIL